MNPPSNGTGATPSRAHLAAVIPHRIKVGPVAGLLLALLFALAVTPVLRVDAWLAASGSLDVVAGEPSPVTVRIPPFAGTDLGGLEHAGGGAILIARGDVATPLQADAVQVFRAHQPRGVVGDLAYFAVVLALTAIYTLQLRRSNQGRLLRSQPSRVCGSFQPSTLDATRVRSTCAVPPPIVNMRTSRAIRSSGRARE